MEKKKKKKKVFFLNNNMFFYGGVETVQKPCFRHCCLYGMWNFNGKKSRERDVVFVDHS